MPPVQVGVVMGSSSDWDTLQHAVQILQEFGIAHEARVVSAHRMPDDMFAYAEGAAGRGLQAIIAGAGGAAHLPGMLASKTTVPVLGVPVPSRHLHGVDSLHSIVQMPKGMPVATFAIGEAGAANAALFAVAMLAAQDAQLRAQARCLPRPPDRGGARHDAAAGRMTVPRLPLLPGATLGVMGGGQLGRMFVHAAQRLGYSTAVLDPDADSPAGRVSHHHVQADYLDDDGLRAAGRAQPRPSPPNSRTCRRQALAAAGHPACRSRPAPTPSRSRRTARGEGALHPLRRGLRAACRDRDRGAAACGGRRPAARHPEDRAAGLRRQGPGARRHARRARARLGRPPARALRAREAAAAGLRVLGGGGARRRRRHGPPAGAAQPAPRRHPGRHRGRRRRAAGAGGGTGDRGHPRHRATGLDYVGVLCVEFFVLQDGTWWSTRWRRGRTTAATGASTRPTCRSSNCRCARWPACRWCSRASTAPRSCSTCWATCGSRDGDEQVPPWAAVLALPGAHLHLYGKAQARARPQDGPPHRDRQRRRRPRAPPRCAPATCWASRRSDAMIRDARDPAAVQRGGRGCCSAASWSPSRPRRCTAWAPMRAATTRSRRSSPPRAGPATIR